MRDKGENSIGVLQERQRLWSPYPNPSPGSEKWNLEGAEGSEVAATEGTEQPYSPVPLF